jgi:hypothetical protein
MSEHASPSGPIWYIVRANEEVSGGEEIVAGPIRQDCCGSASPNHVVRSGAALDTEDIEPTERVQPS